jgi:rRNA maturation RNase YbeY
MADGGRLMRISIANQQQKVRVSAPRLRRLAGWLAEQAGLQLSSLEILLTNDAGIVMANGAVFGRDYVTDVISLAYPPLPGETGGAGELIINLELAAREGARRAGGPDRELALYLAHGCDHLAGADDATPPQRAAMRRRELRWLRAAARAGLLRGLFPR